MLDFFNISEDQLKFLKWVQNFLEMLFKIIKIWSNEKLAKFLENLFIQLRNTLKLIHIKILKMLKLKIIEIIPTFLKLITVIKILTKWFEFDKNYFWQTAQKNYKVTKASSKKCNRVTKKVPFSL